MHEEPRRFVLEGEMGDNIAIQRQRSIEFVENEMRDEGYVPALDMEPQFTVDYQPGTETFKFELSVYGMHVGEDSWTTAGVTNGKRVPMYIPQTK